MTTRYLNYKNAAAYLDMPEGTLRTLVFKRKIPHSRIGPRMVRFELADLDAWIAANKQREVAAEIRELRGNRAASEAHEHAIRRLAPDAARKGFKQALSERGVELLRESFIVPDAFAFDEATRCVTLYEIEADHPVGDRKLARLRALSDALGTVGWSLRLLLAAASSAELTEIDIETGALAVSEIRGLVTANHVRFEMPE